VRAGLAAFLMAAASGRAQAQDKPDAAPKPGRAVLLHTLGGHHGVALTVAFSPRGDLVATAARQTDVLLWDAVTGEKLATLPMKSHDSYSIAFSPDGKRLIGCGGVFEKATGELILWDVATRKEVAVLAGHQHAVCSAAFSLDGARIASCGYDGTVRLWEARSGKALLSVRAQPGTVYEVAFDPAGKLLAWDDAGTVRLWDVRTGKEVGILQSQPGGVTGIAFRVDGRRALTSGGVGRVWDLISNQELLALPGHGGTVVSVDISPDGRLLATGCNDGTVKLWDARTGRELADLAGHKEMARCVVFSPDGRRLATASWDRTVKIWDVSAVKPPAVPPQARTPAEIGALWDDLASRNASHAVAAVEALAAVPGQSLPLLRERLRPAKAPEVPPLGRLIADLGHERFVVREKAMTELRRLGKVAEAGLTAGLARATSAESRRRIELLLQGIQGALISPERLRELRALEILEAVGSPAARQILEALARGVPAVPLTMEAQAVLRRLDARARR
jgi:YD repeat-containing protein